MRLGVDTGGTFTDFVWLGQNGRFQIHKQLSTPDDPSRAILAGVATLAVPEAAAVVHGSTVATNALLERQGAKTALITTQGFGDVLAIGRQNRPNIYALVPQKPEPLVPQKLRLEVAERVTAEGEILQPLDVSSLPTLVQTLRAEQVQSVAVCLLFSFLRPEHERAIGDYLAEHAPFLQHVSLSSDILPEYREYERTATTVINAYVAPLMSRYLRRLAAGLAPRRLTVMQSNGGVIGAETAASQAARTALSGPAGGVVGARFVAAQAGIRDLITFDMGGTSSDVALCPSRLPTTTTGEIADLPLRLPIIDIHTVGAGGGSLAYVDAGGALHVGPQSAGAFPGPVAYAQVAGDWQTAVQEKFAHAQRQSPTFFGTTTDANLVLGRLDADNFLGGKMALDVAAARTVMGELAEVMGVDSAESAALGVIQVANANMERAIRRISVERGYDPRRFTLVPFGGAGPLHACEMAENLQIPRVLIPAVPGVLSALGMLVAAPTKDYSQTVMQKLSELSEPESDWLAKQLKPLRERAQAEMAAEGYESVTLRASVDLRYEGQSHELNVACGEKNDLAALLHEAHEARYGYRQEAGAEVVTVRITAVSPVTPPELPTVPPGEAGEEEAVVGQKGVWFGKTAVATTLYNREKLKARHTFEGPAIVFQYDTTTVVPPNWRVEVDGVGNLLLKRQDYERK